MVGYRLEAAGAGTRAPSGYEKDQKSSGELLPKQGNPIHCPEEGPGLTQSRPSREAEGPTVAGLWHLGFLGWWSWEGRMPRGQYNLKGKLPEWKCDRKPFGFSGAFQSWLRNGMGALLSEVKDHGRLCERKRVNWCHQKTHRNWPPEGCVWA